MSLIFVKFKIS